MSKLQLNEPQIHYKAFPEKGTAKNTEQMPKLIAEGRTPLSASDLMLRRLKVLNASDEVKSAWWDNYFDTGDAVVYHPNGKVKIVLDAEPLRELNPESKLKNGSLILPSGMYETLEGQEFSKNEIEKYTGSRQSEKAVNKNPFWQALARDPKLLKEYTKTVFAQAKERWNYTGDNAGVYLASLQSDVPLMRLWCVGRLGNYALAAGYVGLVSSNGRLVGVAPEAQEREKLGVSKTIASPTLTLEQILALGKDKVAPALWEQYETEARTLVK